MTCTYTLTDFIDHLATANNADMDDGLVTLKHGTVTTTYEADDFIDDTDKDILFLFVWLWMCGYQVVKK